VLGTGAIQQDWQVSEEMVAIFTHLHLISDLDEEREKDVVHEDAQLLLGIEEDLEISEGFMATAGFGLTKESGGKPAIVSNRWRLPRRFRYLVGKPSHDSHELGNIGQCIDVVAGLGPVETLQQHLPELGRY
jgi:hypothetical protein